MADPVERFHDRLNPRLWTQQRLRPEVRLHLLEMALAFRDFLELPQLKIADVLLTGSNAGYSYTAASDIDVHLLVALAELECPALSDDLFRTKKALWTATYDLSIHRIPVELYVEDTAHPARSAGAYSLLHGVWRTRPQRTPPPRNTAAVRQKTADYAARIDALLAGDAAADEITAVLAGVHRMRQAGLATGGEFSTENLVYKRLRSSGALQRLQAARIAATDRALSLP